MNTLLNLPVETCAGVPVPCALPDASEGEIIFGPPGEAGPDGFRGASGANGADAWTTTTAAFTMPAVGIAAAVSVSSNAMFAVGQYVYLSGIGHFKITAKTGTETLSLENIGALGNLPERALIGSGRKVVPSGKPGNDQEANPLKRWAILHAGAAAGTDGGALDGQTGAQGGGGLINTLSVYNSAYNIATVSDDRFFYLPVGTWRIAVRVPAFSAGKFQAYLMRANAASEAYYYCTRAAQPSPYMLPCAENSPSTVGPSVPFDNVGAEVLASGNGYAPVDLDGADPQRVASLAAVVDVVNPEIPFFIFLRVSNWKKNFAEPKRSRVKGVASDFGVAEIYTVVEIDEL